MGSNLWLLLAESKRTGKEEFQFCEWVTQYLICDGYAHNKFFTNRLDVTGESDILIL